MSKYVDYVLNESTSLTEATRDELIAKSKAADVTKRYKTTRYDRKDKVRVYNTTHNFDRIDFNALFKVDLLSVKLPIQGETNSYEVEVFFDGICEDIQKEIKANNWKCEYKCVYRAIINAINRTDIFVACTCPDFCLEGNTKIKLLDGSVRTIKDMLKAYENGEDLWVYSTDEKGDFKPGHVSRVWVSGYVDKLIKVTLDNDKYILTTPNHLYMMRDGSYKEAKDLCVKDSLMPLYFKDSKGYETVKSNSEDITKYYSVYKIVANEELINEIEEAKIRTGENAIAIHHSNFNKSDNRPCNLKPMGMLEHYMWHANHTKESGSLDKFITAGQRHNEECKDHSSEAYKKQAKVMSDTMLDYYANLTDEQKEEAFIARSELSKQSWVDGCFNTDKFKHARSHAYDYIIDKEAHAENTSKGLTKMWAEMPQDLYKIRCENNSKAGLKYYSNEENKTKTMLKRIKKVILDIISAGEMPSPETFNKYKAHTTPRWEKYFNTWEDLSAHFEINHKIKSIEYIDLPLKKPVYDIAVDKYNNFYVDAGVVLHNCYTHAFQATKGRYNAGQPQITPAPITNPNDSKGAGCKHIMNVIANLDWALKLATCVNNYITYIETSMEEKYQQIIFPAIYGMSYQQALDRGIINIEPEETPSDTPEIVGSEGNDVIDEPIEEPTEEPNETEVEV